MSRYGRTKRHVFSFSRTMDRRPVSSNCHIQCAMCSTVGTQQASHFHDLMSWYFRNRSVGTRRIALSAFAKAKRCGALILLLDFSSMLAAQSFVPSSDLLVRFGAPARVFEEAMPTGNGRLGATMYGGISEERVNLNESSMWSGSTHDSDRTDAAKELPEIRRLLIAGDNVAAETLVNKSFTSADAGSADPRYGSYEELGKLLLSFDGVQDANASEYHRSLDLDGAVAATSFVSG